MVDFVLVGALLTLLFVAVLQLALVLYVRNTLIDCAEGGAQFGALADQDVEAGAERTRQLIGADLSTGYAHHVSSREVRVDGLDTVEVTVRAPLPVLGLLGLGRRTLAVTGHALREEP
jgi:hypothetical protein